MFKIVNDDEIHLTRGDIACISVSAKNDDNTDYEFKIGDIVRFNVFKKKDCGCIELQKDVIVEETGTTVDINLSSEDTKIGEIINKPCDYWYEIILNPDTAPQTIVGYEILEDGTKAEKIFKLLPEGGEQ